MLLCISACGSRQGESEVPETDNTIEEIQENAVEESTGETTATEADDEIMGYLDDNVYHNDALGMTFAAPADWTFYDKDQIASVNNMTKEKLEGTDAGKLMESNGQIIPMLAQNLKNYDNINLVIQPGNSAIAAYDDETVFNAMKEMYLQQMESAGISIGDYQVKKTTFNGKELTYLNMAMETSGMSGIEYQFFIRINPDYLGIVTVTSLSGEPFETYLECFDF